MQVSDNGQNLMAELIHGGTVFGTCSHPHHADDIVTLRIQLTVKDLDFWIALNKLIELWEA
jgi:hypothetical protein